MSHIAFGQAGDTALDARFRWVLSLGADDPVLEVDGVWTRRGFLQDAASALDAALSRAGVSAEAPIGLMARNRPGHVAMVFALLARRRSIVMLHAYQSPDGLAKEIASLELAVVIGDAQDWAPEAVRAAAQAAGSLGLRIAHEGNSPLAPVEGLERLGEGPHKSPTPDVAIEMLTSGTTGSPKRVPIRYATLEQAVNDAGAATVQAGTTDTAAPYIQFYPLGNISGLYGLITCASHGQRVVLLEKFTVAAWLRAVKAYRPTSFLSLPPAALRMVLDAGVTREDLDFIPAVRCGSAPLDPELQTRFETTYGFPILINYGATEFCGVIANWTLADHQQFAEAKRGSVGRARPDITLRVVDEGGAPLPTGEIGSLEVLAPRISSDWVRTTDLALIDAEGFVFLKGRSDSVIIRGGFKVSPEGVAEVLRRHPAVLEAAVVGAPDERLGEVPVAAVELRPGAARPDGGELVAFAREHLSGPMVPVAIKVVDALPRTGSMKVDRAAVKAMLIRVGD